MVVVCYLAFDVRMESFMEKERHPKSISSLLIQAAEDANSCLLPLDQGIPIWQFFETPVYRKFRLAQEYLEWYAMFNSIRIDVISSIVELIRCQNLIFRPK